METIQLNSVVELRQWAHERVRFRGGLLPWLAFVSREDESVAIVPRARALAHYPQLSTEHDADESALTVVFMSAGCGEAVVEVWRIERFVIPIPPEDSSHGPS